MSDSAASAVILDGQALRLDEIESVARRGQSVRIGENAQHRIAAARQALEDLINSSGDESGGKAIYGVNTGFGSLARVRIPADQIRQVQRNLIRSHAAGVGEPLADEVVRAMLLILAASLCRGNSGVRIQVVQLIVDLLNQNIIPIVPSRGSVGASGDLAPLAHAGLVLIGEGQARFKDRVMFGGEALESAGLHPITLEAKEGLAIINGTHMMAAIGALALCDVERLFHGAIHATAMAIDACRATDAFLDERLHQARNQPGQQRVAEMIRQRLAGSQIISAHKQNDPRVQDPYCLRAAPQVLGAALDAISYVRSIFENELGAVTDNPLIFAPQSRIQNLDRKSAKMESTIDSIISGGNFHGMPLAIALDTLKIALCHIAGIAERRIYWVLAASDSENPVNIYLSPQPGLHSGMMIVQYTAAACCNELQTLAAPASVHNIPTSAGIEDYNSMGATSALQARRAVELATNVIACELLVMTEAMEYQRPLRSGDGVEKTFAAIRRVVSKLIEDRPLSPDISALAMLIRDGALLA